MWPCLTAKKAEKYIRRYAGLYDQQEEETHLVNSLLCKTVSAGAVLGSGGLKIANFPVLGR